MKILNPQKKPSENICPKKYCFEWIDEGDSIANGIYNGLDDALSNLKPVLRSGCGCTFGKCIRADKKNGDRDWYEPCEPALKKDGLPWFYFIPNPDSLVEESKQRYIQESELLWGKNHWKK